MERQGIELGGHWAIRASDDEGREWGLFWKGELVAWANPSHTFVMERERPRDPAPELVTGLHAVMHAAARARGGP